MPLVSIEKLKNLCNQQGKSLDDLKDKHQISQPTLERIARGENSSETVVARLEEFLSVSRAEFLFDAACLEGAFLVSLASDMNTGVTEATQRKHLIKLAEQAAQGEEVERARQVNDAINALCRALNKSRAYLRSQDEEELTRVNELAQSLALEVLGRMVRFTDPTRRDFVEAGDVPLTMLGVLLHHITGGQLKVRLNNPQARLADDIAECQYLWRITPKPNGSDTYDLHNTLWALIETILPDAPVPEAERADKLKASLAALRRRLNVLAEVTAQGKTVVGLYYKDPHGDGRDFLIDLSNEMKAGCPLVYMHGEEVTGQYLLPADDLVALLASIWSHWLTPLAAHTAFQKTETTEPNPALGDHQVQSPSIAITDCPGATFVIGDHAKTGHQHNVNQPLADILSHLIPALRGLPGDTPLKARTDLEYLAQELEIEGQKPQPEPGRLRTLLERAKSIAEYVSASETIIKYTGLGLAALGVAS